MSFPTGVLRYAGNWVSTETYIYGMFVIASDANAYGCGAVSDTGTDPIVQPSVVWFPYPSSGGGSPSTWSDYPAVADLVMGSYKIVNSATGGDDRNTINLAGSLDGGTIYITARDTATSRIVLNPASSGIVEIGDDTVGSGLAVNVIKNLDTVFGTANQQLISDGSKIQWVDPILVNNLQNVTTTPVVAVGAQILESVVNPTIVGGSAVVTVSLNYQSTLAGFNDLSIDLKYIYDGISSSVLDNATVTSTGLSNKASCVLTGLIVGIPSGTPLTVTLIATANNGQFSVIRASMVVMYNMAPQP